jgi:type IV fimbrial biogenesis protein FimT
MKSICHRGFSLIEVMVAVAILVILSTLAAPSFRSMIANNRITAQANDLVSDLAAARSEAIKRPGSVSICGSSDGLACDSHWSQGRLVFVDGDANGAVDGGDEILRVREALKGQTLVDAFPPVGTAATHYLSYSSSGFSSASGTFTLCQSGYIGRVITISQTGRVSSASTLSTCP